MIPFPLVGFGGVFDATGAWTQIASYLSTAATFLGAAAMRAQQRAHKPERDAAQDLTDMLRRPLRWSLSHPALAIRRKMDRRRGVE